MIVLALDTTTPSGSCAIVRDGMLLRDAAGDGAQSQAARLPRDLMRLLDGSGLTLPDVDAFAVATGPGSFTGVRVGIATMQGLAFAARKPLFGVSALDALARTAGPGGRIATWIEAWRGDVFAAMYDGDAEIGPPAIGSPAELLSGYPPGPLRFIGGGAVSHWAQIRALRGADATLASPPAPLLAGTIGRVASGRAAAGERPPPGDIRPLYVRRPDTALAHHDRHV